MNQYTNTLKFEEYTVNPVSEKLPYVQIWTFNHKIKDLKLVCQYTNGKISGDLDKIAFLRTYNLIPEKYEPSKQLLKDYYEDVERCQTHHQMGKAGNRRNFNDE